MAQTPIVYEPFGVANHMVDKFQLMQVLSAIDACIAAAVNEILHHPKFQALESAWRGLRHVVNTQSDYDERLAVKIKVLHITWLELARDVTRAIEFDQSNIYQRLYSDEFDTPGGEPFGVVLANYKISHKAHQGAVADDVAVLRETSAVAAAALCPFIFGADAKLFGLNRFSEMAPTLDLDTLFQQAEYTAWRALRAQENSRFLGVTLPETLMRLPYAVDGTRNDPVVFEEQTETMDAYLWGNACFAFGGILVRAFANTGWFADIRGGEHAFGEGGVVRFLQYATHSLGPSVDNFSVDFTRSATQVRLDDLMERKLAQHGLVPLCSYAGFGVSVFYSNSSLHMADTKVTSEIHAINSRMSAMLQYILCAARFGHYIKVIGREKVGSVVSAEECQRIFQNWLNQYTTASEAGSESLKAKYPLGESNVRISQVPGRIGIFNCIIHLKPHFQLDQLISSIQIVTELSVNDKRVEGGAA